MVKRAWAVAIILSLVILAATAIIRNQDRKYLERPFQKEKVALDTLVTIKAYGPHRTEVEQAVNQAMEEIERIDSQMDFFDKQSEVAKANKSASKKKGGKVKVSPGLVSIIATSMEQNRKTEGAFDITLGPVMKLWNFQGKTQVPSQEDVQRALALVSAEKVKVDKDKNTISFEKQNMELDLGGVAKGYAADRAAAILQNNGIKRALVTTGSTTTVIGSKPNNEPWTIGIQHPRKENKTLGIMELTHKNISTSGDYQRYFKNKGIRYHHILDPKTGFPARDCMSATIVTGKSCTDADILSTAVFVMGYSKGLKFIESLENTEGVIVDTRGNVHITSGLEGKIKELRRSISD